MALLSSWITTSCLPHSGDQHFPVVGSKYSSVDNSWKRNNLNHIVSPANQRVAAIVYGDESSHSRLYPLTKRRSEAAIPFAGNYLLVDVAVSNCINSNISKIYALTQFNSTSLNSHLTRAYSRASLPNDRLVEVIAACQTTEDSTGWFQGTADAIRRCFWAFEEHPADEFLILPSHHLYKMNYEKLIDSHRRNFADITISAFSGIEDKDSGFGILKLSNENQVLEFQEGKGQNSLRAKAPRNVGSVVKYSFPSMGIYVINRDVMKKLLTEHFPTANSLTSEVISGAISKGMKVHAYQFDGYWENMMSIAAYYDANMKTLQGTSTPYNFHGSDSPLYTMPRHRPPTHVADAIIKDSIIGDGCFLGNCCRIQGSVIGTKARISNSAVIEDSIIMGSDANHHNCIGEVPIGIGEGTHIRKAIIDRNTKIGRNVKIINRDNVEEGNMEEKGYIISGGIIVIIQNVVIPDGTII